MEPNRSMTPADIKRLWQMKKDAEPETWTHPCDNWNPFACMCKGACTCHTRTVDETVKEREAE